MPSVEINERLFEDLKKFAEFLKKPIESVIEKFLQKDIEFLKDNPEAIFEFHLDKNQITELVFGF